MSLKYGILGFLSYGQMTGYDLSKAFDVSIDNFWHASTSQIYRELRILEESRLVEGERIAQTEKPNKKLYHITSAGQEAFRAWLSGPETESLFPIRSAFLLRLFFSGAQSAAKTERLLSEYQARCEKALKDTVQWDEAAAHYRTQVEGSREQLHWLLTADFGRRYLEMAVQWARDAQQTLEDAADKEAP